MKKKSVFLLLLVLATVVTAGSAFAEFLQPFWAEATSEFYGAPGATGVGLSTNSATATHNNRRLDMWMTDGTNRATIAFYLNDEYDLTNIYFWAYNENEGGGGGFLGRGVSEFTVEVSTNRCDTWFNPTSGQTQNPAIAGGTTIEPVQVLSMTASGVNAVRFNTVSNHNGNTGETGISDVAFETTTALRSALPTNDYLTNVTIEAYSSYSMNAASRDPDNLINGDGFEPNGPGTHSTSVGDMWMNDESSDPLDGTPPFVTFDLGDNYDLHEILIWNYAEGSGSLVERSAKDVEIEVATSEIGPFVSLGTFRFFKAFAVTGNKINPISRHHGDLSVT